MRRASGTAGSACATQGTQRLPRKEAQYIQHRSRKRVRACVSTCRSVLSGRVWPPEFGSLPQRSNAALSKPRAESWIPRARERACLEGMKSVCVTCTISDSSEDTNDRAIDSLRKRSETETLQGYQISPTDPQTGNTSLVANQHATRGGSTRCVSSGGNHRARFLLYESQVATACETLDVASTSCSPT